MSKSRPLPSVLQATSSRMHDREFRRLMVQLDALINDLRGLSEPDFIDTVLTAAFQRSPHDPTLLLQLGEAANARAHEIEIRHRPVSAVLFQDEIERKQG